GRRRRIPDVATADTGRCNVVPQPEEHRRAQHSITGPFTETDFGDQPRLQPGGRAVQRRLLGEGRVCALEFRPALAEGRNDPVIETGPAVSGIAQRLALTVAEQQCTHRLARPIAARVAANQEFARLDGLEFQPRARALPGQVAAVEALGDDALEAMLAR